jgi:uncharacterized protein (TIGR03000 family)
VNVFSGTRAFGGSRFALGGFFAGSPFLGGGFGGFGRSYVFGYPGGFTLYPPWYGSSYYRPQHYYPNYGPYLYPYGYYGYPSGYFGSLDVYDGVDPYYPLEGVDDLDHFAPIYSILYSPVTTVTSDQAATDTAARLDVVVPGAAEVWLEGVQMKQKGSVRKLISPPLSPGRKYAYEVRARWKQDGHQIDQVHQVTVRAGDRVTVDFLKPLGVVASDSAALRSQQPPLNGLAVSIPSRTP